MRPSELRLRRERRGDSEKASRKEVGALGHGRNIPLFFSNPTRSGKGRKVRQLFASVLTFFISGCQEVTHSSNFAGFGPIRKFKLHVSPTTQGSNFFSRYSFRIACLSGQIERKLESTDPFSIEDPLYWNRKSCRFNWQS